LPLPVTPEGTAAVDGGTDSGEVAVVPVGEGNERLDAAADDDSDDEELSAPGNSSAGLVAAPPSDDN